MGLISRVSCRTYRDNMEKRTIQENGNMAPPAYAEQNSQSTAVKNSPYPVANHGVYNQPQANTVPINMMPQTQGFVSVVPVINNSVMVGLQNRQNLEPFFFGMCKIHPEHRARHWLGLVAMAICFVLYWGLNVGKKMAEFQNMNFRTDHNNYG